MNPFLAVLEHGPPPIVDCGTCPVSIACAAGRGGTGWTYACCRATSVEDVTGGVDEDGDEDRTVYVIDCRRHQFEQRDLMREVGCCPLCSGGIMDIAVRGLGSHLRYVPTVHAKVAVEDRIKQWCKALPAARARLEIDKAAK